MYRKNKLSKKKPKCRKISNPWYRVLGEQVLLPKSKRKHKISKSQNNKWCNEVKKAKKEEKNCISVWETIFYLDKYNSLCL